MHGVLSPVLGKHGHMGASPAMDDEDDWEIVIWGKAEKAGIVQLEGSGGISSLGINTWCLQYHWGSPWALCCAGAHSNALWKNGKPEQNLTKGHMHGYNKRCSKRIPKTDYMNQKNKVMGLWIRNCTLKFHRGWLREGPPSPTAMGDSQLPVSLFQCAGWGSVGFLFLRLMALYKVFICVS